MSEFSSSKYFFNRELSWLEFNQRVLETALRKDLPVLERLKFLSIFYSNLDEFFMVRVGRVLERYLCGDLPMAPDDTRPSDLLQTIRKKVKAGYDAAGDVWRRNIQPAMQASGMRFKPVSRLSGTQKKFLSAYFKSEILPVLVAHPFDEPGSIDKIVSTQVHFIASAVDAEGRKTYYWIPIPTNLPKVLFLPRGRKCTKSYEDVGRAYPGVPEDLVFLEDVIQRSLPSLFKGMKPVVGYSFRITRNTRLEFDEEEDDLVRAVRDLLERRRYSEAMRLEVANAMPRDLTTVLIEKFRMRAFEIYRIHGPQAFAGMMSVYDADYPNLKTVPYNAPTPKVFGQPDLFDQIRKRDLFVFHPYDNFASVIAFIRHAAEDPNVTAIYQTIYRVGKNSPVIEALSEAQRRGKQVTVMVELKARFDEERNIGWAEALSVLGVKVVYSPTDLKIHAKLCLVERREEGKLVRYAHIATGNYNASTARLYTDMGIFTSHPEICADVRGLFRVMTESVPHPEYKQLLVSPVSARQGLLALIDQEIELHRQFGDGEIDFKCNQLVDESMIEALYRASNAGVRVRLQVRGACSLRPGIPKVSDTIRLTSIVGRFLEHPRIYRFHAHGANKTYIGSADLMARNLDRRIEVLVPMLDSRVAAIVKNVFDAHLADTVQSWELQKSGQYSKLQTIKGKKPVDAQQLMIERVKDRFCKSS